MTTRRSVLQAAMVQGLAGCLGSAMAQERKSRSQASPKEKAASDPAPVVPDPHVAEVLAPIRARHRLPGLIGAIVTGDRLSAIAAVGIRKIGSRQELRVSDTIHLGGCTTAMTATLIGMLVEHGKLSWDSTIGQIFRAQVERIHPQFRPVTLGQLLTHRAGLPANVAWGNLEGRTPTEQRLSIVISQLEQPPLDAPGKRYNYSNVGYALAGLMAEVVAGRPWEDLMRERLFRPLRMTSAGFGPPGRRGTVDQPWGHRTVGDRVEPFQADNPPSMGPAARVHCSFPDWARFVALHLAAARGKPRLLNAETFRTLHTPPAGFEYAAGWIVCERPWAGGTALTHTGSNTMWYAAVWLAPAMNVAFLAATNQGDGAAPQAVDEAIFALVSR